MSREWELAIKWLESIDGKLDRVQASLSGKVDKAECAECREGMVSKRYFKGAIAGSVGLVAALLALLFNLAYVMNFVTQAMKLVATK